VSIASWRGYLLGRGRFGRFFFKAAGPKAGSGGYLGAGEGLTWEVPRSRIELLDLPGNQALELVGGNHELPRREWRPRGSQSTDPASVTHASRLQTLSRFPGFTPLTVAQVRLNARDAAY